MKERVILMNISIREHIQNNFKDSDLEEIKSSIEASIESKDEVVLPGMGVFFELLWNKSDENNREFILNTIQSALKK